MTDTITNAELRRAAERCRVITVGCRIVGRIQLKDGPPPRELMDCWLRNWREERKHLRCTA